MVNPDPHPHFSPSQSALGALDVSIDRDADVPIGVQLAWTLRTGVRDGTLAPGERLPGLREVAGTTGMNVNTVRSVYQQLDREGLIVTRQGSGTFVAPAARGRSDLARIVATAGQEAREAGLDARDLAAALYVAPAQQVSAAGSVAAQRGALRAEIAVLERATSELQAAHPGAAPPPSPAGPGAGPRLLDLADLEQVRSHLLRRLSAIQAAIDAQQPPERPPRRRARNAERASAPRATGAAKREQAPAKPKQRSRRRGTTRPAAAEG